MAIDLGMGVPGADGTAEQPPCFIAAATAAVGGSLIPVPGGVLVRDTAGTLLGAVGVSRDNSDNDEAAAAAAVWRRSRTEEIRGDTRGDRNSSFTAAFHVGSSHPMEADS